MKISSLQPPINTPRSDKRPSERFSHLFTESEIDLNMTRKSKMSSKSRPDKLISIFDRLSEDSQGKLWAYAENLEKAEKLENETKLKIEKLENEAKRKLEPIVVCTEGQIPSAGGSSEKRRKRPHAKDTVRRNYSLSESMANAIQSASQLRGMTASLYIEEVMEQQIEVIQSLPK